MAAAVPLAAVVAIALVVVLISPLTTPFSRPVTPTCGVWPTDSTTGVFPFGAEAADRPVVDVLFSGDRPSAAIVAPGEPLPLEDLTDESEIPVDRNAELASDPVFTDPKVGVETAARPEPVR